jgi:trimethylamine--corrinoid protein Co-methyltransferase
MTQASLTAIPQLSLMGAAQCEIIHLASLEILRRTGVRIHYPKALNLLRETDALITDQNLVRFPPALVEWALNQAPSRLALCLRGSSQVAVAMEGWEVHFGPGSDCRNYLDPFNQEHRLFTAADVINCICLVDALPQMAFCMSMGLPSDLDPVSPFCQQFALMIEHTSKPIVFISGDRVDCELIVAMAAAAAGGIKELRMNPNILGYSQITTPLTHDSTSTDMLIYLAEQSIPIVHMPSPMMGGTAPASMAGALALGNAEILSGLVIHQLCRSGAPFVYGSGLHHIDMRTTISVYGAPEFELARIAVAEMARYYKLPHWGYAGHTDSCVMDEQAASDATSSVLVALLSGQHLVHDVGYMEAGLTTSPELIVFTAEIIERMRHLAQGFSLDAGSLVLDLIHEIGTGGEYLTARHTLKHFRDFWQPELFSRKRMQDWVEEGRPRLGDRLREKTISLIESHRPKPLPGPVREEIRTLLQQKYPAPS